MDRGQVWNNLNSDRHLHLENSSFTLPNESGAINGVNPLPYVDFPQRPNPSLRFRSEIPHFRSHSSENSGPYQHPPAAGSSSLISLNHAQQGSSYIQCTVNRDEGGNVNPQVHGGRASHKRKSPMVRMPYDGGNANGYYYGGSSSDIPISDHLQHKPISGSQHWPRDSNGTFPDYQANSLSVTGERSQRNVRSRHTGPLHLEGNLAGAHLSSNVSHFHSMVDFSRPSMTGQWSHNSVPAVSHLRTLPTDVAGFSPDMNQPFIRSSISSVSSQSIGHYHQNLIPNRNMGFPLPTLHGPLPTLHGPSRGMGLGCNSYDQRTGIAYMSMAPSAGYARTSLEDGGQSVLGAFSRHSRPLAINERRNGERNVRPRSFYGSFQSYLDEDNTHGGRWVSEGILMDRSAFNDSRDLFDQHHDMRLDIDNMSYEELLALEERIGNVNTGLSEDVMSKCLSEATHCSSDQIQEDPAERKCAICLEGYEDGQELGRLKCGHDYHGSCIKGWLLIKNVCPICKAEALKDTLKEKSFDSL